MPSKSKKKVSLVRYCPGEAVGSPAYLDPDRANQLLADDTNHLNKMFARSDRVPHLPHLGACGFTCPHYND